MNDNTRRYFRSNAILAPFPCASITQWLSFGLQITMRIREKPHRCTTKYFLILLESNTDGELNKMYLQN